MKIGDIVLVYNDTTRVNWKLAVIESVNRGADGVICSADIRTATGKTNRPIARVYLQEVLAAEETVTIKVLEKSDTPVPLKRPMHEAAKRGQQQMKEWMTSLRGPQRISWTATN